MMTYLIHGCLHVLTAIVAVTACLMLGLTTPSVGIVEVDSDLMLQRYAQQTTDLEEEEYVKQTRLFLKDMDNVLAEFARSNGVVVVDAKLAIAGAADVTDQAFQAALSLHQSDEGGAAR